MRFPPWSHRLGPPGQRNGRVLRNGRNGNGHGAVHDPLKGVARVDRKTKRLVKRLQPGDIAVIHHADIDRIAAETLVDAAPAAVINAAPSTTGRYPNLGPLLLCQAGITLIDDVGGEVMESVTEGEVVAVDGERILVDGEVVATGIRQDLDRVDAAIEAARQNIGPELERFANNTVVYMRQEIDLLTGSMEVPQTRTQFKGRQVLIVVRGIDYKQDLALLRQSGYLKDVRPVLIGVDGGADALLDIGETPDLIIGDFDSVSERTLRCGAELVVHGYTSGRANGQAPGAERLETLGLPYTVFAAPGTSEDIAMLLAYEQGAELMVAVGTHFSMVEFLDKGRAGMASTFLVRMKVGSTLVDARGVSRLYQQSVHTRDLVMLLGSALFTLALVFVLSEPVRLVVKAFWLSLTAGP
ncbi:MAG: putative cytokinetic ring protein SteA [Acidimicrobiales bacterium]